MHLDFDSSRLYSESHFLNIFTKTLMKSTVLLYRVTNEKNDRPGEGVRTCQIKGISYSQYLIWTLGRPQRNRTRFRCIQ